MTRRLCLIAIACLAASLHAKPIARFLASDQAPYSLSATVPPAATLVFTRGFVAPELGPDLETQARAALNALETELAALSLDPSSIVNLRAYLLAPDRESVESAMPQWNEAFAATFPSPANAPTRTTIGVSNLLIPDALIAIDAILAVAPETETPLAPSLANPRLLEPASAADTFRAIAPYSSVLVTSGVLASPNDSGALGGMSAQTVSALSKLETTLQRWGLGLADLAYARVLLSPPAETEEDPALDRDGFKKGWHAFWSEKGVAAPPFSAFAAPGFNQSGRLVEIEFYAAFPDAAGPFAAIPVNDSEPMPAILREGSDSSFLSGSVALARDTSKTWFSGVIATDRDDIYGQGVEALLTLEQRMAATGVDFPDIAQLRAYLVLDGPFRDRFDRWNRAYKRFFDHPKLTPEKPVRTAFPIDALPRGALIEIEALAATRP